MAAMAQHHEQADLIGSAVEVASAAVARLDLTIAAKAPARRLVRSVGPDGPARRLVRYVGASCMSEHVHQAGKVPADGLAPQFVVGSSVGLLGHVVPLVLVAGRPRIYKAGWAESEDAEEAVVRKLRDGLVLNP